MADDFREMKKVYRPITYICSPYSGDTEGNVFRAKVYSRFALEQGCIPVAPHLLFPQFMDDGNEEERNLALYMDKVLLAKSDEMWVFGSRISSGMEKEIRKAKMLGKRIRFFDEALKEVVK